MISETALNQLGPRDLAPFIQHTRIETSLTRDDIIAHAKEAVDYGFNAAMVPGSWVDVTAKELQGRDIEVASALDFPTVGVTTSAGKAFEAEKLAQAGATQIDVGVQIGYLKSGMYNEFRDDIAGVVRAAGVPIKVMLELPLLTTDEKQTAAELAMDAGAAYLKNASSGTVETANPASIRYLVSCARPGVRVKASGSIKSYRQAVELLQAGAALLGTSAGVAIVTGDTNQNETGY